ncbi:MAG: FecR domain-containing protein [Proteobacteria bacterium]|nr:FecR domain-containing protein [Pseudomonadota bacterium]MBU1712921.1 FecR domain-containing protein [Pseudomonadota bacterium]
MKKLVFFISLALIFVLPALAAEEAGLIKVSRGMVSIERSGQKTAASAGMTVFVGDKIITGDDGSVGITLKDNTLLSAGPLSTIVLNQFAFNSSTLTGAIEASIKRGTLSVVSGKIAKNSPDAVKFHTPAAILGLRGTEFVIDAGSGEEK